METQSKFKDDGSAIEFNFHLPKGTLNESMTSLELVDLIRAGIPRISDIMSDFPRGAKELQEMIDSQDRFLIKSILTEPDDIIYFTLKV